MEPIYLYRPNGTDRQLGGNLWVSPVSIVQIIQRGTSSSCLTSSPGNTTAGTATAASAECGLGPGVLLEGKRPLSRATVRRRKMYCRHACFGIVIFP